jgi:hypothetical protein
VFAASWFGSEELIYAWNQFRFRLILDLDEVGVILAQSLASDFRVSTFIELFETLRISFRSPISQYR